MKRVLLLALFSSLAGCAGLPEPRVYVLNPGSDGTSTVRDNAGRMVVEVRRVLIPDHLDTTSIMLGTAGNQIRASETGVWGERLSSGLTQALAGALARRVPDAVIVARPPDIRPAVQVLVEVTALRCGGGGCAMTAQWTIPRPGDATHPPRPTETAQGRFAAHGEGNEDAAAAIAIGGAVEQLAAQIATRL